MSIFKKWSKWEDVVVRKDYCGHSYLLQQKRSDDNKVKVRNIPLDHTWFDMGLFHGDQGVSVLLRKTLSEETV